MSRPAQKLTGASISAGPFGAWLRRYLRVQAEGGEGSDVPCGECNACCRASYFIHIHAQERQTLQFISKKVHLARASGLHQHAWVMDQDCQGRCPMLKADACSIYAHRPQTCRNYDCRAFAAAGISLGTGPRSAVNERVWQWRFEYPTELDAQLHCAVRAAAAFLQRRRDLFPEQLRFSDPGQLAKAAIAAHELFLETDDSSLRVTERATDVDIAEAIIRRLRPSASP